MGRGLVAAGVPSGQVVLLDPRTGFAQQASMAAHAGGLACMDARSDLVATCGQSTRQGHVVPDIYLKVHVPQGLMCSFLMSTSARAMSCPLSTSRYAIYLKVEVSDYPSHCLGHVMPAMSCTLRYRVTFGNLGTRQGHIVPGLYITAQRDIMEGKYLPGPRCA